MLLTGSDYCRALSPPSSTSPSLVGIFQVGALPLRFEVIYFKNSQESFGSFSMSSFIVTSFLVTGVHPWIIVVLDSL